MVLCTRESTYPTQGLWLSLKYDMVIVTLRNVHSSMSMGPPIFFPDLVLELLEERRVEIQRQRQFIAAQIPKHRADGLGKERARPAVPKTGFLLSMH